MQSNPPLLAYTLLECSASFKLDYIETCLLQICILGITCELIRSKLDITLARSISEGGVSSVSFFYFDFVQKLIDL